MLKPFFVFFLSLISLSLCGQRTLSGLWSGITANDSVTVRKDQSFEIALTQYKDKVYGFTRSSFFVNDTLYYIIKRVKGTVNGEVCEIKDDDIISSNFPGKVDKGVKVTSVFRMNKSDSTWHLDGDWRTNVVTKRRYEYYSLTGKVNLREETNLDNSKLLPHLEELKLAKELDFYQAKTNLAVTAAKSSKDVTTTQKDTDNAVKKDIQKSVDLTSNKKESKQTTIITNPSVIISTAPAALVKERVAAPPQIVNFKSDSIQLAIYDNGEIDGDTVSVLLNGEVILAKQGLKATAIRKTIYIQPGTDEVALVLYAENLGKYPPNTGLLVVTDGEQSYQLRFSADLQQNSTVIFRRKK